MKRLLIVLILTWSCGIGAEPFPTGRDYDPAMAMFDRADFYFDQELYAAAAAQYDLMARQYARRDIAVEAQCRQAVAYEHLHRYHEADRIFARLWTERPWLEHPSIMNDLYLYWIKTKISLGQPDEAQQLYSAFKMSSPDSDALSETTFAIAEHFYLSGQKELARLYLENGHISGMTTVYADYLRGIIALEESQDERAEAYFQAIIDFPTNLRYDLDEVEMMRDNARNKLALLHFHHQRYEDSIHYYNALHNDQLWGADQALGLAWCYFQLDDYEQVDRQLNRLFKEYPKYRALSEATFLAGVSAMHTRAYERAITYFQAFIDYFVEYPAEEKIRQQELELQAEKVKLLEMDSDLANLESKLVALADAEIPHYVDLILAKKESLRHDLALVQKMLDGLAKRRSELPLLIEAEYGIAKARLKLSLASPE